MYSAEDIAKYFLNFAQPEIGEVITNLKLQKLCYYAQGFSLAMYNERLFPDKIEAWTHGPVVPTLYHKYKRHEDGCIPRPASFNVSKYDKRTQDLLNEVYSVYGQYSAWKLRNMTHEEPPWIEANDSGKSISTASMKEYFKTLVRT
jgi:uncharacterized phage-associated protein